MPVLFNGARSLYFFDHRLIRREQLTVVHRAIKYTRQVAPTRPQCAILTVLRLHGITEEIYPEGDSFDGIQLEPCFCIQPSDVLQIPVV